MTPTTRAGRPMTDAEPCDHKWVHLRNEGTTEVGYRHWKQTDLFYCEKCLEQKRILSDIPEKRSHAF